MNQNIKIAIIILNYNSWKESIQEADLCHKLLGIEYKDIIIIDNASSNESYKMLSRVQKDKKFILLLSDSNQGYATGNNIGMKYAFEHNYKFGWILNNDIIFHDPEILDKMITVFSKDQTLAVVSPDVYAVDGHRYNRDAVKPTFFDLTIGLLNYRKKGRIIKDKGGYGYVYRPQGCCMLVDLKKMAEINYMDENTFLYCEELILAERLLRKNYHCACCFLTDIIHNHSKTVNSVYNKSKILHINNTSFEYYLRQYRKFNKISTKICVIFNDLKWLFLT